MIYATVEEFAEYMNVGEGDPRLNNAATVLMNASQDIDLLVRPPIDPESETSLATAKAATLERALSLIEESEGGEGIASYSVGKTSVTYRQDFQKSGRRNRKVLQILVRGGHLNSKVRVL